MKIKGPSSDPREEDDCTERPVIESVTNQEKEDSDETRRIEEEKQNTSKK
jgi:hypothetical protein